MVNNEINRLKINGKWKWVISIFFFGLLFQSCQSSYKYLSQRSSVECEFVGYKPMPTKSYPKYERFRDETKNDKLKEYLSSSNLIIRAYSYWALIEKLESGYLEILDLALKDTSKVREICGCVIRTGDISNLAYMNFLDQQIDYEASGEFPVFKYKSKKTYQLDSLIIFHQSMRENLIEVALFNREYEDENILNRITNLALSDNSKSAKDYIKRNLDKASFKDQKTKLQKLEEESFPKEGKEFLREIKLK